MPSEDVRPADPRAVAYVTNQARRRALEQLLRALERGEDANRDHEDPCEAAWGRQCGRWAAELRWALRGGEPCGE